MLCRRLLATLGSTVNTCTAFARVFSGPEVDSRPALLGSSFLQNGEARTVDASVGSRAGSYGNLDTTFTSLRTWQSLARCLCIAVEFFYPVSDTGGAGVAGSFTPR